MTDNRGVRVDQSLRFAEQIVLLLADADSGQFARVPDWSSRCALAGAVLMDLAMENRIDTDPEQLFVIDSSPVGDDLLDPTLAEIAQASEARDTRYWVRHTADQAHRIRDRVLERLVGRGILHRREGRVLWVFPSQRYPTADPAADRDVKRRILAVLFSDDIPDPRDAAVVGLADTAGLLRGLLPRRELDHVAPRIVQVRKLDLIGRVVSRAVWDLKRPLDGPTVHVLGPASRLPSPGKLEAMAVDGAQFVIANVGGRYHALDGLCEHAGAPLAEGKLNGCRLTCPLHGWIYDVTDGRIVKPALNRRARSYTVRVTDGTVRLAERD